MKHLDKSNKWWRPWNIPVGKCSSEIYTNTHSHGGACGRWIQTAWELPNTEWPEMGRKMQRLTHKHITCLWYAIIKCQQQIGFLTFTKKESGNERVTSPGPALPSEARLFIFMLTGNCPAMRALGLCKLQQFQMERQPHKMTSVSPRRKNNNKFIHTDALKWILTWVSSREKRTQ